MSTFNTSTVLFFQKSKFLIPIRLLIFSCTTPQVVSILPRSFRSTLAHQDILCKWSSNFLAIFLLISFIVRVYFSLQATVVGDEWHGYLKLFERCTLKMGQFICNLILKRGCFGRVLIQSIWNYVFFMYSWNTCISVLINHNYSSETNAK